MPSYNLYYSDQFTLFEWMHKIMETKYVLFWVGTNDVYKYVLKINDHRYVINTKNEIVSALQNEFGDDQKFIDQVLCELFQPFQPKYYDFYSKTIELIFEKEL